MIIGVNARIYQKEKTGIPYFIECLYKKLIEIDKSNRYVFFQTDELTKKIGRTKILSLSDNNLNTVFFDNFLIDKLIKSEKIDIFHGPAHILPFFKIKKVKYLLTVHDLSFLTIKNSQSLFFNFYYRFVLPRAVKNADLIVADSQNTKNDLKKNYEITDSKIKVIHLGVNDVYFTPKNAKRLINKKYFLSLTTHPKRKNISSVLKVLASNKNLLNYQYVVAGLIKDDILSDLKKEINQLRLDNQVRIFGYATENELKNLYQNAEFFIYPSFYEGFGLPILEAMACGCPVIASNNSSIPEIFPDKRWLINPYDLKDIDDKINNLMVLTKIARQKLIKKNYFFAKKFTWENTARSYLKIFQQLFITNKNE